ncbi:hypothetical protein CRM22_007905 [Opisthorchis felineus]|uniref:Uncharacterized protein n=1 Tax=Opisthorchis felineus TaxID=147828 RepID=A0A4S2LE55_OPIFE|nr:hypothetical protein CRM22_007905 [Opisthorchis felineus]
MSKILQKIPTLPLSTTMPAYSKLNKRRRVTCRKCGLPFGYVPLSCAYLEADLAFLYDMIRKKKQSESGNQLNENNEVESERRITREKTLLATNEQAQEYALKARELEEKPKTAKRFTVQIPALPYTSEESADERMFLSMFMPDCINVRVNPRCGDPQIEEDGPCGILYRFKFLDGVRENAEEVKCSGCDSTIGVRFEPASFDKAFPAGSLRSSQNLGIIQKTNCRQKMPSFEEESDKSNNPPSTSDNPQAFWDRAEREGWISLSLECVDIEPLFGLVGLDQFSIRYEGGEMSPLFYHSIESDVLFSQNSATWMVPARRTKGGRHVAAHPDHQVTGWDKVYYDLEHIDKAVPNTLGHGDMVQATVRRLCPIYSPAKPTEQHVEKVETKE